MNILCRWSGGLCASQRLQFCDFLQSMGKREACSQLLTSVINVWWWRKVKTRVSQAQPQPQPQPRSACATRPLPCEMLEGCQSHLNSVLSAIYCHLDMCATQLSPLTPNSWVFRSASTPPPLSLPPSPSPSSPRNNNKKHNTLFRFKGVPPLLLFSSPLHCWLLALKRQKEPILLAWVLHTQVPLSAFSLAGHMNTATGIRILQQ